MKDSIFNLRQNLSERLPSIDRYLAALSNLAIDADGVLLSDPLETKEVIRAGKAVAHSLSRAIHGVGLVLATGEDIDLPTLQVFGYLVSQIGEILITVPLIQEALKGSNDGARWPTAEVLDGPVGITKLLWLLPFAPLEGKRRVASADILSGLKNSCECTVETETISMREFSRMLEVAVTGGELGEDVAYALRLSSEWTALIITAQNFHNLIDCHEYVRDKAA